MIKAYDMASGQPIGDEEIVESMISEPGCEPAPATRLMSVSEAVALERETVRHPGPVVMTRLDILFRT